MKQSSRSSSSFERLYAIYAEERALFGLGVMGIILGVVGLVIMTIRGGFVPPEGQIYKAASFDFAIGIYTLTLIVFIPLAGLSSRGRKRWRMWSIALVSYVYFAENTQIYRGLDPRFTRVGSIVDLLIGTLLGVAALGLIATFVVLAWRFFSDRNAVGDALLLLAIRYGCAAVILAFVAGFWMGIIQSATVGPKGNLLPLHAVGFHGLQAVPLVALLLGWFGMLTEDARRVMHAAGIAWLCLCAAVAWQSAQGRTVIELSPATVLAASFFAIWFACGLVAGITRLRSRSVIATGLES